jgi:hypothetical protein
MNLKANFTAKKKNGTHNLHKKAVRKEAWPSPYSYFKVEQTILASYPSKVFGQDSFSCNSAYNQQIYFSFSFSRWFN